MLLEELYTHMDINIKLAMAALFYLTLQVFLPFFFFFKKKEIYFTLGIHSLLSRSIFKSLYICL